MANKKNDYRTRVTKMLIRKAFTDLMQQKPIQSISIKELCEKAGINRGTFYSHYKDIYDLLEQTESIMADEIRQALTPLFDAPKSDSRMLPDVITGIFQCLQKNADICAITLGPYGDQNFINKLMELGLESCLQSYSAIFADASPEKINFFYTFVSWGYIGILRKWFDGGTHESIEETAKMCEEITLKGIGFFS